MSVDVPLRFAGAAATGSEGEKPGALLAHLVFSETSQRLARVDRATHGMGGRWQRGLVFQVI